MSHHQSFQKPAGGDPERSSTEHRPGSSHLTWSKAGPPAVKAVEALAAAARAQGATADFAILVSIASSLKSFVLGTQVQELQGADDPLAKPQPAACCTRVIWLP